MNTTQAQEKALDDALVALADHLEFRKCNMRLKTDIKPKEATFQVVLDALALTPFYQAFLITAKDLTNQAMLQSKAYKTYYAFTSGEKTPKPKYVRKKANSETSPKQKPVQATKGTRLKTKAKVAKSDKKKQHAKIPKAKGLDVLSKTVADEGTGTIPGVPDVPIYKSESEKESWGNSGEEDKDDENDSEDKSDGNDDDDANDDDNQEGDDTNDDDKDFDSDRTESNRIKIPVLNQFSTEYYEVEEEKIEDEETMDEEEDDEVTKELYDDVNVNLGNKDTDMTNANQADNEIASLMETLAHHATTVLEITSGFTITIPPPPSFFNPLLQQATPTPTLTTSEATTSFTSLPDFSSVFKFNKRILPQAVSNFATPMLDKNVTESLEAAVLARSSSQLKSTYEAAASLFEFKLTNILLEKIEERKSHLRADYKKKLCDALVESYNTDKDLFDTYGEVFTLKRSRDDSDKDGDPSAGSNRGTKRRKSSKEVESSKDSMSKEKKSTFKLLKGNCKSLTELEYHLEECSKATTEQLDWYNPEGKPPYSTSVTKIKAATYKIKWIEDLVRNLWSPVKVIYDKHAYWGISSWGPKRQHFYEFATNMSSLKDVYSRKRIIAVTRLTIMKKYDYSLLEEIKKLTNLIIDEWYALNVALHMFTRRIVIQRRVEYLQLGVKSYQKKLNLTKPDTFRSNLKNRTAYTAYLNPKGVIYKDQMNINRLMRVDELHKFSDDTLNDVQSALNDIAMGIRMEYLPKRKWNGLEK
ncbi:hypothetical protein Tco_0419043 [Tanacetum coccineum]